MWGFVTDDDVRALFAQGETYSEIAARYHTTRNAVAGRCHRLGLSRTPKPVISKEEQAERAIDQRDLDILYDIQDGHTHKQLAEHWGVSRTYIHKLERARKDAN